MTDELSPHVDAKADACPRCGYAPPRDGELSPHVDAKAVLITRGGAILTLFNEEWGAFTLPMTKTRMRPDRHNPAVLVEETPKQTATRAAAEALGRPLAPSEFPKPHPVLNAIDAFNVSGRNGEIKTYHIEIFYLELPDGETPRPVGCAAMAWMTPEEMRTFEPVSVTAIKILGATRT